MKPAPNPYRRAGQIVYVLICVAVGASVSISVTAAAFQSGPPASADAVPEDVMPGDPAGRACAAELRALHASLRREAGRTLASAELGPDALLASWRGWSDSWRDELDAVRSRCRLRSSKAMEPLRQLAHDLERLGFAYTTALSGFAEVGRRPLERFQERRATSP